MSELFNILKTISYYDEEPLQEIELPSQILNAKRKLIGKGVFSRAFLLENYNIVMKEGRWDLDLNLWGEVFMPLPSTPLQNVMKYMNFNFQPTKKEFVRQYRMYVKFMEYFGYFQNDNDYFHPELESIKKGQKEMRSKLKGYRPILEDRFQFSIPKEVNNILDSDTVLTNFIPKEFTFYSQSISKENKGNKTSYIFQEFIKGKPLCDFDMEDLPKKTRDKIILFLYLVLVMNYETDYIPDTRPKYPILQFAAWFHKTENIIISDEGEVKFIDTRWMWERKSNLVKRGVLIPEMILLSSKFYLNYLLRI